MRYGRRPEPPSAFLAAFYALARPYLRHVALREMDETTAFARAATQPHQLAARALIPKSASLPRPPITGIYPVDRLDAEILPLEAGQRVIHEYAVRARRRAAAVALAARLYRADHSGNGPPSVDALVPDYLTSVPPDPLGGRPSPQWPLPTARTP